MHLNIATQDTHKTMYTPVISSTLAELVIAELFYILYSAFFYKNILHVF